MDYKKRMKIINSIWDMLNRGSKMIVGKELA